VGKLAIGALAFAGGFVVGALVVRAYVMAHPLEVLAPGAAQQLVQKIFGTSDTANAVGEQAYSAVQHLVSS
jgi:hypothetical protein